MYEFDYAKPSTLAQAQNLMGEDIKALAGGQTYLPTLKQRLAMPEKLVDLALISELKGVCETSDGCVSIGAMTTHADVAAHSLVQTKTPGLAVLAGGIGDPAVRHRGTLGGSLANNDPAACYPAAVLALKAIIHTSKQKVHADDFFQGLFTTCLDEDELITHVDFPAAPCAYIKFKQPASRFAMAGVFVVRHNDGLRVAVTGAGQEGVFRWAEAEQALQADPNFSDFKALSLEVDLIEDMHADADYRAQLVRVCADRAIKVLG